MHSDLPPSYSTLDLSPGDAGNITALHSNLPAYSTLNLSPEDGCTNNTTALHSELPPSYSTLNADNNMSALQCDLLIVYYNQDSGNFIGQGPAFSSSCPNPSSEIGPPLIRPSSGGNNTRFRFVQKVITIIMMQLVFAGIVYGIIARYHITYDIILLALLVAIVLISSMACCKCVRRTPLNFIFLGIFTVAESILLAAAVLNSAPAQVLPSLGMTIAIMMVLPPFALLINCDCTIGRHFIFLKVVIFIFGITFIFIHNNIFLIVYGCVSAPILCLYLVCDVQLLMEGKHKFSISSEEYIFAALNLYLVIVNIFIFILNFMILNSSLW